MTDPRSLYAEELAKRMPFLGRPPQLTGAYIRRDSGGPDGGPQNAFVLSSGGQTRAVLTVRDVNATGTPTSHAVITIPPRDGRPQLTVAFPFNANGTINTSATPIRIDDRATLPDGKPNPNVGKPHADQSVVAQTTQLNIAKGVANATTEGSAPFKIDNPEKTAIPSAPAQVGLKELTAAPHGASGVLRTVESKPVRGAAPTMQS